MSVVTRPKLVESFYYEKISTKTELYTPLTEAIKEAQIRFSDKTLQKKVRRYLGTNVPTVFNNVPRAVLFRNIISPTNELLNLIEVTKNKGILPLGLEYTSDKFSTRNQDKLSLAKLPLIFGRSKNGEFIIRKKKIIDIKASENLPFRQILTEGNESLPHFHHCLLKNYLEEPLELFDMSDWVKENGDTAIEYYKKFFAFFIAHGVLFECFITNDSESEFADRVIFPAFDLVTKEFGMKPLIVNSCDEKFHFDYWNSYPGDIIK